ncbi:MAG: hypothetical protein CVT49_11725 [candidate division Zixibacteria bacterium HGW-Zixibacteria-1]|nr:MAG: hypothetical protein CVT49_11725 [candidate division Zixibacteria bacterium HGW-Zixibacteria-1]
MSSEESKNNKSVIVVKKKNNHGGHHGGAWKVAYADFVTAMMAFFLVMWLVSQSEDVKESVQGYFQDPVGFMKSKGQGLNDGDSSPVKAKDGKSVLASKLQQERELLLAASNNIKTAIDNIPELAGLKDNVEMEMTPEGLRIQLIESGKGDGSDFFDLGSARLKSQTSLLLTAIASELGKLPNSIIVEGHTDSKPYSGTYGYSNWELSADRANSARKLMASAGLRQDQIVEIRGNADKRPRYPDDPLDPRNRRVVIIVLNEDIAETYRKA